MNQIVSRAARLIPIGLLGISIGTAALGAAAATDLPASADELFAVFLDLRSSIVFNHSIAQYEDPRFYGRAWLEDAIKSGLNAGKQPDRPGLNWVQDSC